MSDDAPISPAVGREAQREQIKQSMGRVVGDVVPEQSHGLDMLVKNYWPLFLGVITIAVAWGILTAQVSGVRSDVATVLTKLDVLTDQNATVKSATRYNEREIVDLRDRVWKLEAKR